jgi:hypothetical protein
MGDIHVRNRGGLTAVVWIDKREISVLTNVDKPPPEGSFCNENKKSCSHQL